MIDSNLIPPVQYDVLWAVIVGGLIILLTIFYVFLFAVTKKIKQPAPEPLPDPLTLQETLSALKNKYVVKVTGVEEDWNAGLVTGKEAFQSLSVLLRNFSHEYSTTGAYSMTLSDLKNSNVNYLLTKQVAGLYPTVFSEMKVEENIKVEEAVAEVLGVIQQWG